MRRSRLAVVAAVLASACGPEAALTMLDTYRNFALAVLALAFAPGCIPSTPEVTLVLGTNSGEEFVSYESMPELLLYSPSPPGNGEFTDASYVIVAGWTYVLDGLPEPEYVNGIAQYHIVEIESHLRIPDIDFEADFAPRKDAFSSVCCSGMQGPVTDDRYQSWGDTLIVSGDRADSDWAGLPAQLWGRVILDSGEVLEFDYTLTTRASSSW
jgi:hypothetical protein